MQHQPTQLCCAGAEALAGLTQLRHLSLASNNMWDDACLAALPSLPALQTLSIAHCCELTSAAVPLLTSRAPHLTRWVDGCKISRHGQQYQAGQQTKQCWVMLSGQQLHWPAQVQALGSLDGRNVVNLLVKLPCSAACPTLLCMCRLTHTVLHVCILQSWPQVVHHKGALLALDPVCIT